ncbi:nicotinate phosphoribosyltransferase [Megamonas hypermegale]|jgi:nicotinate phosphoribosyltransferase|uniref:nicotinate phosphoribosyltransferase n=1 Tax=Megamonas hypermegale TaxID=158847 RepID=UPI000B38D88F|nr:nicotinate phosphoribosyltransferase [Megamonas hypermegale]MBM6760639.1 nicotinate phosphoribosyltransferase [Megamonas hypermegale]OUO40590.1 nicotinate phosphoribosyltransferase [Megamonas hypermegale]
MNSKNENLAMLCDFYEFTMGNGYLKNNLHNKNVYFDVFFRNIPDDGGFAIAAGLQQVIEYIEDLHFNEEDIEYFRSKNLFSDDFIDYLKNFHFTGDIYAVPEGTCIFPREPIMTIKAPAIEAQILETFVLLALNHQSLIATKANRIVRAAQGRAVLEFGSRRAQGADGAVKGARAAYIGGCAGTACTLTDELYGVPAGGTMAHAWVQMFDSEYEAFKAYCEIYPHNAVLLVDTYNTLKSGVPNAIRVFKEMLVPQGITNFAIRLDSGDISYLSKQARKMLDDAGLTTCKIVASNALDEHLIRDLIMQGAQVDTFGVGERMITSKSAPVFGGVYKLVAVEDAQGNIIPKIKLSENTTKITNPHFKKVYRLYDNETGKAIADEICLHDEFIDNTKPHVIFDPVATWKQKTLTNFTVRELQVPIFKNGKRVYDSPSIDKIRDYCKHEVDSLWDEVKRFENPHRYYVDLSQKLWDIKKELCVANSMK